MSGGNMRSHTKCKKSEKFNHNSPICEICGYRVFYEEDGQEKLFAEAHKGENTK